jgi:uncharacterized protein
VRDHRSLIAFFGITFGVSWTLFAAADALPAGGAAVRLLGVVVPSLVALALTARAEGREGALALLRRIVDPRVRARWYVFAAGYMIVIKLAVAVAHRAIAGAWPPFGPTPLVLMAAAVLVSTPVQAGEEIGWRGYALPRLGSLIGLGPASLVLGVVWACWHLPFFLMAGTDTSGQSFPVYLSQVTALSVAMTWLYWRVGGTLLPLMVMHAAINNTKDIVPSAVPGAADPFAIAASSVGWLTLTLLWICAAYFLVRIHQAARHPASAARGMPAAL